MIYLAALLVLLLLIFGPQLWTRYVFRRYSTEIQDMPGTGGELAEHLLEKFQVEGAKVEETGENNDHYDPESRTVRLSPHVYNGKSLTAVTVAAHECGHALQHHTAYSPLFLRWKFAKYIAVSEKIAALMLITTPFLSLVTRSPAIGLLALLAGFIILFMPVLFHLITLPVEFNASFARALPILIQGRYIPEWAIPVSRRILTAAALTYVSASLASLLNIYRWMVFLRR